MDGIGLLFTDELGGVQAQCVRGHRATPVDHATVSDQGGLSSSLLGR